MQTFDKKWEIVHQERQWGKYPAEELIRFMGRQFKNIDKSQIKVLDLGCGTGAGTWFLAREGFQTYATDGSETAIKSAQALLTGSQSKIEFRIADAARQPFPNQYFDCIVDIACITSNTHKNIIEILCEVKRLLKPGGVIFSSHLFMASTSGSESGESIEANTKRNLDYGAIANIGTIHFFTKAEIRKLWQKAGLNIVAIDSATRTDYNGLYKVSYYMVTAAS